MTIYSYEKVTALLTELNLESRHCTKRESYFKKLYPALLQQVYHTTSFLGDVTFIERLFYYANGISDISQVPKCKMCNNPVEYNRNITNFRTYCSNGCISRDPEIKAMKDATDAEYMANNGGVSKRTRSPEARAKVGANTRKYRAKKREVLVDTIVKLEPTNLTQEEYNKLARRLTEYMYTTYKHELDPDGLRSKEVHIDHMVSIVYGFMNNIPIYLIGDITNLRMMDGKANISKNCDNHITFDELLERYNAFYVDKERPVLDVEFVSKSGITHYLPKRPAPKDKGTKFTEEVGVCVHCGGEAHYIKYDGTYLCQQDARKCPAKRRVINKKNRELKQQIAANKLNSESLDAGLSETPPMKRWFNNGIDCIFAIDCPVGYVEGRGKLWFNNGEVQVFAFSCPAGFSAGMLNN
jgi:hypothetical protein